MQPAARLDRIDALRGAAMVWMTAYHFCFDLNHFGYWRQDFYRDPFWTWQRACIVALFLVCAGLSQAVALQQRPDRARFARRWGQIAGCALLVSLGSWLMYPQSFIYFGVLHGMALMLLLVRAGAAGGRWLWPLGALALALPALAAALMAQHPGADWLNQAPWNVLGLVSRKPITEDYVPLLPWLGWMCWGLAAGQALLARQRHWLAGTLPPGTRALAWLGRRPLTYYMLHQPVLIGLLSLASLMR